jgi:cysteine synthase
MPLFDKITDLIGGTPLVRINRMNTGGATIYAKMESLNPFASVKDRVGLANATERLPGKR